jgi:hypothetical protein
LGRKEKAMSMKSYKLVGFFKIANNTWRTVKENIISTRPGGNCDVAVTLTNDVDIKISCDFNDAVTFDDIEKWLSTIETKRGKIGLVFDCGFVIVRFDGKTVCARELTEAGWKSFSEVQAEIQKQEELR